MTTIDVSQVGSLPRFGTAWVTWRQHRLALFGVVALLAALAALLLIGGLDARSTYDQLGLDQCTFTPGTHCDQLATQFINQYRTMRLLLVFLLLLPGAFGAFVGGPLVARELESGTYRFAWTQGAGRTRWILTKLLLIAAGLVVASAAFSPVYSWWNAPFQRVQPTGFNDYLGFEFNGIVFPVQTLLAFAAGVLAGLVFRRSVVAVGSVFLSAFALLMATTFLLRKHYMTPLTTSGKLDPHDWALGNSYQDPAGHLLSHVQEHTLYQQFQVATSQQPSATFRAWLEAQHYTLLTNYHPASRFWSFQLIETGWMSLLTLLLAATTVWLIRRRT
ncbi:MAG: hypothetical protein JWN52_7535 [Actinomycetia bacterium]|nr:hypothetical protein [Actinomycetes bacterium]